MLSGTRPTDKHESLPLSFRAKRGICFFLMLNHKSRSLASLGMTSSGFFLCLLGEPDLSSELCCQDRASPSHYLAGESKKPQT